MATALISAIPHAVPLQGREPHFTSLQRLRKVFGRAAKTTPSTATQNCAPVPKPKEPTPQLQAEELTGQLGSLRRKITDLLGGVKISFVMLGVGVVGSAISVELGVVGLQEQGNIPNPTGLLLLSVWGLELSVPVTLAGIGFLLDSSVSLLRTSLKIRKLQKQLDSAAQGPAETTN